ncbi:MAG: zinc-ribbon domain-containing protein [Desulfobacterales bacterium]
MDITCDQCQSKFRISDDKIPPGKTAVLTCPKCKNKLVISSDAEKSAPGEKEEEDIQNELYSQIYDASEKPFDFVEEEAKTALLCEPTSDIKQSLLKVLDIMDYHITEVENIRDALTKMRYHNYDLILLNENFDTSDPDTNGVLMFLARQPMSIRRDMFVVLISTRFRTMDNMMAFNKSVNLILNPENIADAEKIVKKGIVENDQFYRVYRDLMKEVGRV